MILKVSRLGHPVLRQASEDVDPAAIAAGDYDDLAQDMFETMEAYRGVGLAGPQVHLPIRMFVYDAKEHPTGASTAPATGVVFNATYEPQGDAKLVEWEGCLSVPFLGGQTPRFERVRVRGLGSDGTPVDWIADGFLARIFQHEIDHTLGFVYLDRMESLSTLSYTIVL
jgi:peptide deformylase